MFSLKTTLPDPVEWNHDFDGFWVSDISTFFTDSSMAIVSVFLAFLILRQPYQDGNKELFRFFFFFGICTQISGFGHLLKTEYPQDVFRLLSWTLLGFSLYNFQLYALLYLKNKAKLKPLKKFIQFKLAVYLIMLPFYPVFVTSMVYLSLAVLGVFLPIMATYFRFDTQIFLLYYISGVGLLVCSAIFHVFKIGLHPMYFDHRSVGHIFVIFFLFTFYRGFKLKVQSNYEIKSTTQEKLPKGISTKF